MILVGIITLVVVLIIVFIILFIGKNKTIKNYLYKINIGETEIINDLKIKLNIISKICNIQIEVTKIESNLFTKIKSEKEDDIKSFACVTELEDTYKEILSIDEDYQIVLKNNEEYKKLLIELDEVNTKLTCLGTFYNKYANEYNKNINDFIGKFVKKKYKYEIKKLYLGNTLDEEVSLN